MFDTTHRERKFATLIVSSVGPQAYCSLVKVAYDVDVDDADRNVWSAVRAGISSHCMVVHDSSIMFAIARVARRAAFEASLEARTGIPHRFFRRCVARRCLK